MSEISSVILGICVTAATGGLINLLAPNGNMSKNVKTAVTLFMIVSICTSFKTAWKNSDVAVFSESQMVYEEAGKIIEDNVKSAVLVLTEEILERNGISFSEIDVETYVSDENEILIEKISIYGINDIKAQETADEIFEKTGAEVHFIENQ